MQKLNFWHSPYVYAILCLDFAFLHCKSSTLIQNFSKFSIVMTKTKIGTVIGMHQTISSQVLAQKSDIGFFNPPTSVCALPLKNREFLKANLEEDCFEGFLLILQQMTNHYFYHQNHQQLLTKLLFLKGMQNHGNMKS